MVAYVKCQQTLEDFKNNLQIFGSERALSREAIIEAGKNLPADKAKEYIGDRDYKKDSEVAFLLGIKTIKITMNSFKEAINKLGKEKCLVILPFDTNDGIKELDWKKHPQEACCFFQLADIFESRKEENIQLFLNIKTEKNKGFIDDFYQTMGGKPKPVISGSDAHKIADYGSYPSEKATWIKAEATFRGLRKILVEPASRTYIGDKPNKLKVVANNATKFISEVTIKKLPEKNFDEIWFNNILYFNPELVAVIGNKGSGKSALADILGLLGNSRQESAFSFLNEKKFRERQSYKAGKYLATIIWESKDTNQKILSDQIDGSSVELVKYIPQSYLEKLCNEITLEKSLFDQELKAVIFSHISESQRLGYGTLDELTIYKTEEMNKKLIFLRNELSNVLQEILLNEEKLTEQYKLSILNQLSAKQNELVAHQNTKPKEPSKPLLDDNIDSATKASLEELEIKQAEEKKLNQLMIDKRNDLDNFCKKKAKADKLLQQVDFIEKQYAQFSFDLNFNLKEFEINLEDVFSVSINRYPVNKIIESLNSHIDTINNDLNTEFTTGIAYKLNENQAQIKKLSDCIDEPNQRYQAYLDELDAWGKIIASIQGDINKPGTIKNLNARLAEIQNIPVNLNRLEEIRDELIEKIYLTIAELADIYRQFYAPVQDFVNASPFPDDTFKMSFNVSITDSDFRNQFLSQLNRNRAGSFCGIEESEKLIGKIFEKYNFDSLEDVKKFVREIIHSLKFDCRNEKKSPVSVKSQVKDDGGVLALYNFIFSLEYLKPKYSLKLNDKNLQQLSPGERGTLLLIFYLMVDKDDRPLILDQPEENLDNQTIYKVLVPCIKNAKKKRQLFLITHNPNLAVVCDAEQIIVTSIDKSSNNTVNYHCGSIENLYTNKYIVDILEGTYPAFNNRKSKYFEQ